MSKSILEQLIEDHSPGMSIEQIPVVQMEGLLNSNTTLNQEDRIEMMREFLNQGINFYRNQILERIKYHQEITETQFIPNFDCYTQMRPYRPIIDKIINLHYKRDGIGKAISPRELYKSIIDELPQEN